VDGLTTPVVRPFLFDSTAWVLLCKSQEILRLHFETSNEKAPSRILARGFLVVGVVLNKTQSKERGDNEEHDRNNLNINKA
jgi:hypothetical protein